MFLVVFWNCEFHDDDDNKFINLKRSRKKEKTEILKIGFWKTNLVVSKITLSISRTNYSRLRTETLSLEKQNDSTYYI